MEKKQNGKVKSSRIIVFSLIVCLIFFFAFSEEATAAVTGKIAGTVKNSETGEPLPLANCIILGTEMGAACDTEGHYYIINVPPGTYSVTVRMMGYETVTKTGIEIDIDHTTEVNFELRPTEIEVPGITVVARREVIKMDLSSSSVAAGPEEISAVPFVTDVNDYIGLQAGIEDEIIRGGGLDQTAFMINGLMLVDNRTNEPITLPNISSIRELGIIKGGFNAEYGNVRSGVVNIVTHEGSPNEYHGSVNFQMSPPRLKHSGVSVYDHDNYYLRPYLDEDVCWVGTENGTWDEEMQDQYRYFEGWNSLSERLLADGDPTNDMTPEECRDLFIWQHRAEGASELIPEGYDGNYAEGHYGDKPDWNVDLGFGGPVPVIGEYLGKLSFFASYRNDWRMFGLPTVREYYKEDNFQLKLTSRIAKAMKFSVEGLVGKIKSVAEGVRIWGGANFYVHKGENMFTYVARPRGARSWSRGLFTYYGHGYCPFDVYYDMEGVSFEHTLSPATFYSLKITRIHDKDYCTRGEDRDTTTIRYFGNTPVNEAPWGYAGDRTRGTIGDNMMISGRHGAATRDFSEVSTINFKGDLTSQVNKYNQIKVGLEVNYDDLHTRYYTIEPCYPDQNSQEIWDHNPIRASAYLQDKIEFAGIIANLGARFDYFNPNCEWYTVDRYSDYFKREYKNVFEEVAPSEPAESHLKISPRLGISHPITENAKLFFNYGHFYSMAPSEYLYRIESYRQAYGITKLGNPSADLPRTVAYELGFEQSIADLFLLHIAGYYKDVSDQIATVYYENYDGSVHYDTYENNNYEDIRGFEIGVEKRFGKWITGWLNYHYMVTTSGYIGREEYYQDERIQRIKGLQNPYQETPIATPLLRANVTLSSPEDFGPTVAGIKPFGGFNISFLYTWQAGEWITWNPLGIIGEQYNVQWKDYYMLDARLSKKFEIGGNSISLFMDINNLLNIKHLCEEGFSTNSDYTKYMESLHLPLYKEEIYEEAGYTGGDDRMGEVKSDDKPYINMPDREFLTYLDLRYFTFGLKISF